MPIGIPIITQSDPGTENYGVANAHTVVCHCLEPSLTGTLQHHFTLGHNNIFLERKWSVFCCIFLQVLRIYWSRVCKVVGTMWVNSCSHIYSVMCFLSSLLFHWIAIPWLQAEINDWVKFKNTTTPQAVKHRILSHGIPALIYSHPSHFNSINFKVHLAFSTSYSSLMYSLLDTCSSCAFRWSWSSICSTGPCCISTGTPYLSWVCR